MAAKRALAGGAEPALEDTQIQLRPAPFLEVLPQLLLRLPLLFGVWVFAAACVWTVDWVLYNQSVDEAGRRLAEWPSRVHWLD